MKKKYLMLCVAAVFTAAIILLFVSCADNGDEVVTVTLVFKDSLTGEPVTDVAVFMNGQTITSDETGSVSISSEGGPLTLEAYVDLFQMTGLGYQVTEWGAIYERVTVTRSFVGPYFVEPLDDSLAFSISGTVKTKDGADLTSGSIIVLTPDGRIVGSGIPNGAGNYTGSIADYPNNRGELYFAIVESFGDTYYTVRNVTGSGTYDLSYEGTDITITGEAGSAETVYAKLQLGGVFFVSLEQVSPASPYTIDVPHRGSDTIRLSSSKTDAYSNDYRYYSPTLFTVSSTEELAFAMGSTVNPQSWDSDLSWDKDSRTLTWNAAGNASMYDIQFNSSSREMSLLIASVDGTSLTVPQDIDIAELSDIYITPTWTQGTGNTALTPWSALSGTTIRYGNLTDSLNLLN